MPHERNWPAALQCLFAVIPDALRDGQPAAVVPTIRSWKTDMPHLLAKEWRSFEGENETAGVYALRLTLEACAHAIETGLVFAVSQLPNASHLVTVLATAKPFLLERRVWQLRSQPARSPLDATVGTQLANYRPKHDIAGAEISFTDWDKWYHSIDSASLSNLFQARTESKARKRAIFATIQWMYYALWCKRITFNEMPTHEELRSSIVREDILTFGASPAEIGWANEVGVDVAFLNRHLLNHTGSSWQPHNHPPTLLHPDPDLAGHYAWQARSLLKPRIGYRMRKIYGLDM